jgi:hypothetical protein
MGMSELAHYLVDSYSRGEPAELPRVFSTIEDILQDPDPDIEGLIKIGLF